MSHQDLIDRLVTYKGRLEKAKKATEEFPRMPKPSEIEEMAREVENMGLDTYDADEVTSALGEADDALDGAAESIRIAIESVDSLIKLVQDDKDNPGGSGDDAETPEESDTRTRW